MRPQPLPFQPEPAHRPQPTPQKPDPPQPLDAGAAEMLRALDTAMHTVTLLLCCAETLEYVPIMMPQIRIPPIPSPTHSTVTSHQPLPLTAPPAPSAQLPRHPPYLT